MAAQYIPIKRISTLDTPITAEKLDGSLFTTENQAHEFIISVRKNGVKQAVTGSVSGKFIRANGTTIFLQGSVSNGDAVVRLHQDCYNVQGRFTFNIFNTQSGVTTCIYSAVGKIDMGSTETVIDAGDVVPDISDVVAKQEEMTQVIADARTATTAANTAATNVGSIVARSYSPPYKAGEHCTQNGNLYKAKQDIPTDEEWTASHWTQIVVGDEVTDLNNNTVTLKGEIDRNASLNSYIVPGVYWHGSTRTVTDLPDDITSSTPFVLTVFKADTADYKVTQMLSVFGTKTMVYFRTYQSTSAFGDWVKLVKSSELADAIGELADAIGELAHFNLMNYNSIETGGYFNERGGISTNSDSEYCSAYIHVKNGETYRTNSTRLQIVTYDANKEFIERKYNQNVPATIAFDANVMYVRISIYSSSLSNVVFATTNDYNYVSATTPIAISGSKLQDLSVASEKIASQAVDESKTTFFTPSVNVLNPDACEKDKFIDGTSGIRPQATSEISHTIPVIQGDIVRFTPMDSLYLAKYETDNTYVRTALSDSATSYTVETDGYIRFARYHQYFPNDFMVTINNVLPSEFEAYGSYTFNYETTPAESENYVGKVSKTTGVITVDINQWRFLVNRYDNNTTRAHLWRVNDCQAKDENGVYQRVWYSSDSDGVVHLPNEDDFLGGYHGDETQTVFKIFIDGVEYDGSSTFSNLKFNEVVMYCESDVYHCNTSATPDVIAFKRNKIIRFNSDGYIMENHWVAQEALTVTTAYMGMLSIQQYLPDGETVLLEGYIGNDTFGYHESGATISNSQYLTDTEYFLKYGHLGIKIEDMRPSDKYMGHVAYYGSGQLRNKTYLNLAGSANIEMAIGDIIHAKATTYFR